MHAFGQYYPVNLEVRTAYAEWLRAFPNLLAAGYKSNPVWKQEGGLERIKEGLDLLKEGKVLFFVALCWGFRRCRGLADSGTRRSTGFGTEGCLPRLDEAS